MTAQELRQLYYLNREIEEQKQRLKELETAATGAASRITGMPYGYEISDKVGNYSAEIADLKAAIEMNMKRCWQELNKLTTYINSVDDSLTRQILTLRYINGLPWAQVAACIGGGNTEDSVRKIHTRFLEREKEKCK